MKVTPPELTAIHPDTGFAFSLSDEAFSRWWSATILPEDAANFVHLHHGTLDEARFVCAVDYITNVEGTKYGADTILRAYFLAKNLPIEMGDSHARVNAHYLSASDAVGFLLDRVRLRSRRIAEERIANRTAAKIEELFVRASVLDGPEQLNTERLALEMGTKYLANQARERGQEEERRTKKAAQDAIKRSQEREGDMKRLPSLAEAKNHMAMLAEGYGVEALAEILKTISPKELNADNSRN
jgi:hypothetical protein